MCQKIPQTNQPRSVYVQGLRLWNSQDREAVQVYKYEQRKETVKQSALWSSLGNHGCYVFSPALGKFI